MILLKGGLLYICEDLGIKVKEGMGRSQILKLILQNACEEGIRYALRALKKVGGDQKRCRNFREKERDEKDKEREKQREQKAEAMWWKLQPSATVAHVR